MYKQDSARAEHEFIHIPRTEHEFIESLGTEHEIIDIPRTEHEFIGDSMMIQCQFDDNSIIIP